MPEQKLFERIAGKHTHDRMRFDPGAFHSWDDVMRESEYPTANHHIKTVGEQEFHRNAGASIGEFASIISPWLDLLPSTAYSSVVCGGLKLLFGVSVAVLTIFNILRC